MEGYKAPVLMLISGTLTEGDNNELIGEKWVVGALVPGGFDNKEVFYGNSGCCLFAISPHFEPLRSTGTSTVPLRHTVRFFRNDMKCAVICSPQGEDNILYNYRF